MEKRKIILGDYNTAERGWTLAAWKLEAAEQKTTFVDKPNGDGSWDLSTALTDGVPKYKDRSLVIVLECSEGTRMERETIIRHMVNTLHGARVQITLPDDDDHYLSGRLHVARDYNDLAHAAVTVTAVCDPWKYAKTSKIVTIQAAAEWRTIQLVNEGCRAVVPLLAIEGDGASVVLKYGTPQTSIGEAQAASWPDLLLTPGTHVVEYQGTGKVTFTYREAVLE